MANYFVAQIRINDHEEYEKYLENFDEIFSKYKGEYLAIDESPTLLEGEWDYTKAVLLKFNSKEEFDLIQAECQSLSSSPAGGQKSRLMDPAIRGQLVKWQKEVIATWKA